MRRGSIFKITIMSKTVEQRADEFINEYFNIEQHGALNVGKANDFMEKSKHEAQMKAAYIKGAADQQEIDYENQISRQELKEYKRVTNADKWRAKNGDKYWAIFMWCGEPYAASHHEHFSEHDNINYSIGNYFKTKEAAEAMAARFVAMLKGE